MTRILRNTCLPLLFQKLSKTLLERVKSGISFLFLSPSRSRDKKIRRTIHIRETNRSRRTKRKEKGSRPIIRTGVTSFFFTGGRRKFQLARTQFRAIKTERHRGKAALVGFSITPPCSSPSSPPNPQRYRSFSITRHRASRAFLTNASDN